MTRWLIKTEDKKCAWSVDTWERNGVEISLTTLYRWGSVIVEQDLAPEFDPQYVVNITEEFPEYEMNDLEKAQYIRKLNRDIEAGQEASAQIHTEKLIRRCRGLDD
mgnify:CR=1 FL=1